MTSKLEGLYESYDLAINMDSWEEALRINQLIYEDLFQQHQATLDSAKTPEQRDGDFCLLVHQENLELEELLEQGQRIDLMKNFRRIF